MKFYTDTEKHYSQQEAFVNLKMLIRLTPLDELPLTDIAVVMKQHYKKETVERSLNVSSFFPIVDIK